MKQRIFIPDGTEFGSRTVLFPATKPGWYIVRCVCGREDEVKGSELRGGRGDRCRDCAYQAKFLGENRNCLHCGKEFYVSLARQRESGGKYCSRSCNGYESGKRSHGHNGKVRTPTYNSWAAMIQRTTNPNCHKYSYYGGRGITVCDRWLQFENFLADMSERPKGLQIERRENDLGYFPENCYWGTRKEQMNNTRWNRMITVGDKTQSISMWAEETGLSRGMIMYRLGQCLDNFAIILPYDVMSHRKLLAKENRHLWVDAY